MQKLGIAVGVFGVLTAVIGFHSGDASLHLIAFASAICAYTTWRSANISSFLKIFVAIFSTEVIVFGFARLVEAEAIWPEEWKDYTLPESMSLTVAIFSILVFAISHIDVVGEMTRIADLFFDSDDKTKARVWPFPAFTAPERIVAVALIVILVLINQTQVGISVRLSFFNRDWFNAMQEKNAPRILAPAALCVHAMGVCLRIVGSRRICSSIDVDHSMASLAYAILCVALAWRS